MVTFLFESVLLVGTTLDLLSAAATSLSTENIAVWLTDPSIQCDWTENKVWAIYINKAWPETEIQCFIYLDEILQNRFTDKHG